MPLRSRPRTLPSAPDADHRARMADRAAGGSPPYAAEAAAILDLESRPRKPARPAASPTLRTASATIDVADEPADQIRRQVLRRVVAAPRYHCLASAPPSSISASPAATARSRRRLPLLGQARARPSQCQTRAFAPSALAAGRTPGSCSTATAKRKAGIGNDRDLVGRFFCDRPAVFTGNMLLADRPAGDVRYFTPTPALSAEQGLARCAIAIEPRHVPPPPSFLNLVSTSVTCISPLVARMLDDLRGRRTACYFGGIDEFSIRTDRENHPVAAVGISLEQRLNPDSRVTLCLSTDPFGLRRVELDWQLTEDDYRTYAERHTRLRRTRRRAGHRPAQAPRVAAGGQSPPAEPRRGSRDDRRAPTHVHNADEPGPRHRRR